MERLGFVSIHGQRLAGVNAFTVLDINRCLCCDTEQNHSLSPESLLFHGSHKVLLTVKIHSLGFIRWSEVAKAPKTNRGLKSLRWPGAQDTSCCRP